MDFAMRYGGVYRHLATVFGVGPKQTTIQVIDDMLHVRHGRKFCIDVSLKDIKSARLFPDRPLGWGIHQFKDGWLIRGSRDGIVELTFGRPIKPTRTPLGGGWFDGPVRSLYVSLVEPDAFIALLMSRR